MWADTSGHGSRPYLKLSARPVWLKRRLVSLASQADVLRVSSRVPAPRVTNPWERLRGRLQTPARPTLRVVNNWEESAAFEMTFANGLTFLSSRIWMKKLSTFTFFFQSLACRIGWAHTRSCHTWRLNCISIHRALFMGRITRHSQWVSVKQGTGPEHPLTDWKTAEHPRPPGVFRACSWFYRHPSKARRQNITTQNAKIWLISQVTFYSLTS